MGRQENMDCMLSCMPVTSLDVHTRTGTCVRTCMYVYMLILVSSYAYKKKSLVKCVFNLGTLIRLQDGAYVTGFI